MRNAINVKPVLLTLPGCHHFSIRIIALPSPPCWHHTLLLQLPPATCHLLLLPPGNIVNDNSSQASRPSLIILGLAPLVEFFFCLCIIFSRCHPFRL